MPRKIALVTDSTCDLPEYLAFQHGITVVPQLILWDGYVFRDGVDLTAAEFYRRLSVSSTLPETAPPGPEDFAHAYQTALDVMGAQQVVAILISSKLSQTFLNAQAGARLVDFPVYVQDTLTVSMGLGFAVLSAARARDDGAEVEDVLEAARSARRQTQLYFTVDTLDYLYRGGRIGGARRLIGTALNIKPLLTVQDGQVEALENVRTRQRAVQRLLELAGYAEGQGGDSLVALMNGDAEEEAVALITPLRRQLHPAVLIETSVSSAIGANTGPGVLGIAVCRA